MQFAPIKMFGPERVDQDLVVHRPSVQDHWCPFVRSSSFCWFITCDVIYYLIRFICQCVDYFLYILFAGVWVGAPQIKLQYKDNNFMKGWLCYEEICSNCLIIDFRVYASRAMHHPHCARGLWQENKYVGWENFHIPHTARNNKNKTGRMMLTFNCTKYMYIYFMINLKLDLIF